MSEWRVKIERPCEKCAATGRKDPSEFPEKGTPFPDSLAACEACGGSGTESKLVTLPEFAQTMGKGAAGSK